MLRREEGEKIHGRRMLVEDAGEAVDYVSPETASTTATAVNPY